MTAASTTAAIPRVDCLWRQERRELYCGIPVTIIARDCSAIVWENLWRLLVDADAVFNRFSPTSEISRLADLANSHEAKISPCLATGIRAALRALFLSRGASDASIRPLVALWRQAVDAQVWPETSAIHHARSQCRLHETSVDGNDRVQINGHPWKADLDLGGVIKGVLVDQVAELLRAAMVTAFLVQIGGETTTHGLSSSGRPWRIGVQNPFYENGTWMVLHAPMTGMSCSTSADYRRGWCIGDRPVSHLIDPRTGLPANPDLLTAHVAIPACGRCGDAEALTKAVALLTHEEADRAVAAVGGAWLHLEASDDGVIETRSPGFSCFTEPT